MSFLSYRLAKGSAHFRSLLTDNYIRPYGLPVPYRKFHERFASLLASHGGRPHWAKQHALKPKDVEMLYPKFNDFKQLLERVDPEGVMRSEYVRRHIEGEDVEERLFKKRVS